MSDIVLQSEIQWVSPDETTSIDIVSTTDPDTNQERFALAASVAGNTAILAEFTPGITFDVIVSVCVVLQTDSSPRISERLQAVLEEALNDIVDVIPVEGN